MKLNNAVIGAVALMSVHGCISQSGEICSQRYPELNWGFTTQNFLGALTVSVESSKELISYAKKQGYSWIELRDPDASLSTDDCKIIASFARSNEIQVNYSVQRGLLSADFMAILNRAVQNSAVFEGPGFVRALALKVEGQHGWSESEFKRAVTIAKQAAVLANQQGLRFTVENADVALDGRDQPYYGMWEFLEQTSPEVLLQLDTANLFTGSVAVNPAQAEQFLRNFSSRISYLHLKTAADGQALQSLQDNPLAFDTILDIAKQAGAHYIAIELNPGSAELPQIYQYMESSIEYLTQQDILEQ